MRKVSVNLGNQVVYVSGDVNGESVTFTLTDTLPDGTVWEAEAKRDRLDIYRMVITAIDSLGNAATYNLTVYYGLNLIIDRQYSDIEYANEMRTKSLSGMTDKELEIFLSGLKGTYNASDLNRVETAVEYVVDRLKAVGCILDLSTKTNWKKEDVPTPNELERYLDNVSQIRDSITVTDDTPHVPESMYYLTYEEANDIERILMMVNILIENIMRSYYYSNELYAGEV